MTIADFCAVRTEKGRALPPDRSAVHRRDGSHLDSTVSGPVSMSASHREPPRTALCLMGEDAATVHITPGNRIPRGQVGPSAGRIHGKVIRRHRYHRDGSIERIADSPPRDAHDIGHDRGFRVTHVVPSTEVRPGDWAVADGADLPAGGPTTSQRGEA